MSLVGVFLPALRSEAFWIGFRGSPSSPVAVKVAIEELDAISGRAWRHGLHDDPQDYVVCPPQRSLDGVHVERGLARQFVPAEVETLGDKKRFTSPMRIVIYDAKKRLSSLPTVRSAPTPEVLHSFGQIGVQPGSFVEQRILSDPHGIDSWDQGNFASLFVYWLSPEAYREVTGEDPPAPAGESQGYKGYRLP